MRIQEKKPDLLAVFTPRGPLVGEQADALKEQLTPSVADATAQPLVDFSNVSRVDSRALEVLVEVNKDLVRSGRSLKLCGLPASIRQVLDLTDILELFECFKDLPSAREALR